MTQTPYELFQQAIEAGIGPTMYDCWIDFAHWEKARQYFDDPSHPAKAAIAWISEMEDLRAELDEFEGAATDQCRAALDAACDAFARIEHTAQLSHGIETWIESRLSE